MKNKNLSIEISNIKSINDFSMNFDLKPGLICLVGANGTGKSTILNAISLLMNPNKINTIFFDEKRDESCLKIVLNNKECVWNKDNGKWVKNGDIDVIKGFFESGIIYGNRFVNSSIRVINKYCQHYENINVDDLIDAQDFIYKNLGKILKGNEYYYKGLKTITKSMLNKQAKIIDNNSENYLLKKEKPFLLLKNSGYITQYKMSSGEYLLLKILDYIYYRITYNTDKSSRNEPFLIIIDEVEIALHPSSQKRFIQFCNQVSKENNICIIFSTHSRDIISNLNENQIYMLDYYIDSGNIKVTNPCYPNYAMRGIYEPSGYDYIIFVEDSLAKKIVLETISNGDLSKNKLINVSALGGWREVLNFTHEFKLNGMFNTSKVIIVLDGDVKDKFLKEYGSPCCTCNYHSFIKDNKNKVEECGLTLPKLDCNVVNNRYPYYHDVTFLPISSLEKEFKTKLVTNPDYDFICALETMNFFNNLAISDLVAQYKEKADEYFSTENFKKKGKEQIIDNYDLDGKILWRLIVKNTNHNLGVNELISYLCKLFPTSEDKLLKEAWSKFEKDLTNLLKKS
ncbi:AAA family ATPase [uncultured Photobacterium sp.]|uniref:AAA family ATPase n=1 Tax=uncultured Photobacterium sp. TaxID=173973 RepID=UPI0026315C8F|nr:AAA family ATPase [uncultured Photobacterium sp.]